MSGLANGVNIWSSRSRVDVYNQGFQPTLAPIHGLLLPLDKDCWWFCGVGCVLFKDFWAKQGLLACSRKACYKLWWITSNCTCSL